MVNACCECGACASTNVHVAHEPVNGRPQLAAKRSQKVDCSRRQPSAPRPLTGAKRAGLRKLNIAANDACRKSSPWRSRVSCECSLLLKAATSQPTPVASVWRSFADSFARALSECVPCCLPFFPFRMAIAQPALPILAVQLQPPQTELPQAVPMFVTGFWSAVCSGLAVRCGKWKQS